MVMQSNQPATSNEEVVNHKPLLILKQLGKPTLKLCWLLTRTLYNSAKDIGIPVVLALSGFALTQAQFETTNTRQDAESADKAIETREQVLTDYSKSIAQLLEKNNLMEKVDPNIQQIIRGQTLIALRRLNVANENDDASNSVKSTANLSNLTLNSSQNEVDKDEEAKVEAGKLKGMLIRYLYEAKLIQDFYFHSEQIIRPIISLSGADIDNAILEDAWLYDINFQGAWLRNGSFKNADLTSADFTNATVTDANFISTKLTGADLTDADLTDANLIGANLTDANLTGANLTGANLTGANLISADLRFADLTQTNLDNVNLSGACYVQGEEASHLPAGFDPVQKGMVAIPKTESYPDQPGFKPCPAPQ